MTKMRLCALALAAVTSLTACPRPRPTGVAAVLTDEVAQKLPKELFAFVDVLPAEVTGFGYVDFGAPLLQLLQFGPDGKPMVDDLVEMAQRRWGIDPSNARGLGVAAIGDHLVVFGDVGAKATFPSDGGVTSAKLGAFTIVGSSAAVQAMQAAATRGLLAKTKVAWVKSALSHAAGQSAFYTFPAEALPKPGAPDEAKVLAALSWGTITIGSTGGAAYLDAKPGQVATLRAPIDKVVGEMTAQINQAANLQPRSLDQLFLRMVARYYGTALTKSFKITATGDLLSLSLPWHGPVMPKALPTPGLEQRVIAHDEWAVVQLDFGNPLALLAAALTDVLASPLPREELATQIVSDLTSTAGLPAVDPRGAVVSVGGMAALISVHGTKQQIASGVFPVLEGQGQAASTPWGYVVTPSNMVDTLEAALDRQATGLPLAQSSRLAARRDVMMRAFVDLTRLPMMLQIMVRELPILTIEMAGGMGWFEADVVAKSGQAAQVQQYLNLAKNVVRAPLGNKYQERKSLRPAEELGAIIMHHQLAMFEKLLTPKISGDRLTFSYTMPKEMYENLWSSAVAAGALAGVGAYFSVGADRSTAPTPSEIAK